MVEVRSKAPSTHYLSSFSVEARIRKALHQPVRKERATASQQGHGM